MGNDLLDPEQAREDMGGAVGCAFWLALAALVAGYLVWVNRWL